MLKGSVVELFLSSPIPSALNVGSPQADVVMQEKHGTSLEDFFELLQEAAEEQGLMEMGDCDFQDWVPLKSVEEFIGQFNDGAQHFMAATFPDHYLKGETSQAAQKSQGAVGLSMQKSSTGISS